MHSHGFNLRGNFPHFEDLSNEAEHLNFHGVPDRLVDARIEDIDWTNNTVSFFRKKTGVPVLVQLGGEA
jgi:hypothetical protein